MKQFNQWHIPLLLPLALGGDTIPVQLLASYMYNLPATNILPSSYYSHTRHSTITILDLLALLTKMI